MLFPWIKSLKRKIIFCEIRAVMVKRFETVSTQWIIQWNHWSNHRRYLNSSFNNFFPNFLCSYQCAIPPKRGDKETAEVSRLGFILLHGDYYTIVEAFILIHCFRKWNSFGLLTLVVWRSSRSPSTLSIQVRIPFKSMLWRILPNFLLWATSLKTVL